MRIGSSQLNSKKYLITRMALSRARTSTKATDVAELLLLNQVTHPTNAEYGGVPT